MLPDKVIVPALLWLPLTATLAADGGQSLDQAANDPTASLMAVQIQNIYAGNDDRDEVKLSILQPIFNYSLPKKWSIGVSEMNVSYD
jgi:hypothetical protein